MTATTTREQALPTNVSGLLGIGGRGPWLVFGIFVAANATFALITFDQVRQPLLSVVALAVVVAAGWLLIRPAADPFPLAWTAGVVLAVIASTVLISWQIVDEPTGTLRANWHIFASVWLLFFTVMRGRTAFAWLGFFGMVGVHAYWAYTAGESIPGELGRFQTGAGLLLVGSLFTLALRRTSQRITQLNSRTVELASAAAETDTERETRASRVTELAGVAAPLLQRIARGSQVTEQDRRDYLLAESTLRDSVRARSLHEPEIVVAASAARGRGVEVTLLDDRGAPLGSTAAQVAFTERVVASLRAAQQGAVTVRLAPAGRPVAGSIVIQDFGGARRIDIDESGTPIAAPESAGGYAD